MKLNKHNNSCLVTNELLFIVILERYDWGKETMYHIELKLNISLNNGN